MAPEAVDIETSSAKYARRFQGETGRWFLTVQGKATLNLIDLLGECSSVLEVGGGHGQLTPFLVEAGYRVSVHGSTEDCRARIENYVDKGQVEFRTGDLFHLLYADQSFDIVIAYHLLSHLSDVKPFLRELARVSKLAVIVDYPTHRSLNGVTTNFFWLKKKLEGNTRQFISYHERDVNELFQELGFDCVGRFAKFFLPMVVHRVMKLPRLSSSVENFFRLTKLTDFFGSPVIACFERKHRG
jgi:ubiquinone/menaquinone biosynthesis C-methylase UbiE